jgi:tetratricopeptide (TPR) repeat protein/ferredoxin
MYTLELGIVTAGFLLMAFVCVGTLVFGRFFCSWACHILALEDLCAWILERLRIRPKPVRSRVLLVAPLLAMIYMFVWPQALRMLEGASMPALHLRTDAQGWSSFLTTDFWRNLPTLGVALTTFAVCGFAIVYVLGTRAFCSAACPYGALFAQLDRVAPGRIVSLGGCSGCGQCTAACTSHIQVHEELRRHGTVVNPACLRDLDCVAACPGGNVRFGFTVPPLLRGRWKSLRLAWDFGWREEIQIAAVGLGSVLALRGLYGKVPFLLSIALGCIAGYLSVVWVRSFTRANVRFNLTQIRREGRLTPAGWVFLAAGVIGLGAIGHSGFVRWHEVRGAQAFERLRATTPAAVRPADTALLEDARAHLEACARYGLVEPRELTLRLGILRSWSGDLAGARDLLGRAFGADPGDGEARIALARVFAAGGEGQRALALVDEGLAGSDPAARELPGWRNFAASAHDVRARILAGQGEFSAAREALREAVALGGETASLRMAMGEILARAGDLPAAEVEFAAAVRLHPDWAAARFNHGGVLAMLGRTTEALAELQQCVALDPRDPDAFANLGWLELEAGRRPEAERAARRALALQPGHAGAANVLQTLAGAGPR